MLPPGAFDYTVSYSKLYVVSILTFIKKMIKSFHCDINVIVDSYYRWVLVAEMCEISEISIEATNKQLHTQKNAWKCLNTVIFQILSLAT